MARGAAPRGVVTSAPGGARFLSVGKRAISIAGCLGSQKKTRRKHRNSGPEADPLLPPWFSRGSRDRNDLRKARGERRVILGGVVEDRRHQECTRLYQNLFFGDARSRTWR